VRAHAIRRALPTASAPNGLGLRSSLCDVAVGRHEPEPTIVSMNGARPSTFHLEGSRRRNVDRSHQARGLASLGEPVCQVEDLDPKSDSPAAAPSGPVLARSRAQPGGSAVYAI
jgi:hypothetical protein